MTIAEIKEKYFNNRTYASIEKRCNYLGLKKRFEIKWTPKEDHLLKTLREAGKLKIKEIHEKHFAYRTYSSVRNRARLYKKK